MVIVICLATVIASPTASDQTIATTTVKYTELTETTELLETTTEPIVTTTATNTTDTSSVTEVETVMFKVTAYCPCKKCCGKSDGITSTGVKAKEGRTIAVDPKVIPYGTEVIMNGNTYIAEDCGGAIKNNRIDLYFDSHQDALDFGVQYLEVVIL